MASALLELLYRGERAGAERMARTMPQLDVFEAAALGALEALIERCEEDAERVRAVAADGWTPLHLAAYFGNTACVKELLRRGAPIDAPAGNAMRVTPLGSACAGDHTGAAAALIAAGADVNAAQSGGHRPLDSALANGNAELAARLRAAGAQTGRPAP